MLVLAVAGSSAVAGCLALPVAPGVLVLFLHYSLLFCSGGFASVWVVLFVVCVSVCGCWIASGETGRERERVEERRGERVRGLGTHTLAQGLRAARS